MPAPPYIRFFHEAYCQDTIKLTMEEQGAYIRLLCAMWRNGGKIVHDDSVIAQSLPINTNKWFKVKPALMPFLKEDEGFLTQNRLAIEYHFSSGDKKANNGSKPSDAPPAAGEAAPHAPPHAAWGAAPHATPHAVQGSDHAPPNQNALAKQDIGSVLANGLTRACARALDQSKSRRDKNRKTRFLEDGGGDGCGKLSTSEIAAEFVNRVHALFERHRMTPPFDYPVVESWINNGCDLLRHVVPAVEASLDRLGQAAPPRSWKYFAREVYTRQKSRKENNDG